MSSILKFVSMDGVPVLVETPPLPVPSRSRSPEGGGPGRELVQTAQREAQEFLDNAAAEAARIVEEARSQVVVMQSEAQERGLAAGFDEGMQKGLGEGRAAAHAEVRDLLEGAREQAAAIIASARESAQLTMTNAERDIVEIALAAARKILAREIEENPMVLLPVIREALDKVRDQEQITVRVNPDDFDMIIAAERDMQKVVGREYGLTIRSDNSVSPGGCFLETENGVLDAGIDTQYQALLQAIQEILP